MIALRQNDDTAGARRAFWLKVGLLTLGILVFVLAGTSSARAEHPFPKTLDLPNGFAPEGIATGRGTDFFAGSLAGGALYKGDLRTGDGAVLAQPVTGRAIAGLKVDRRTNYVFASGTQSGKAFVFDGDSGALLAEYQLAAAGSSFINDVVITSDAAYFTNSFQPFLYRLPLGPDGELPAVDAVEQIALAGDFVFVPGGFNANGIDAPWSGEVLLIVHSSRGELYSVDPASGDATLIDLNGGSVPNGDGILLDDETLYVVQNRLNKIAVIDIDLAAHSGQIARYITDSLFRVPTTIARFGSRLYAVNARFGTPVTPDTEYEAVQVRK